jgi:hypothetical protein
MARLAVLLENPHDLVVESHRAVGVRAPAKKKKGDSEAEGSEKHRNILT